MRQIGEENTSVVAKEELMELLDRDKKFYSDFVIDYFRSLIEAEMSIFNDSISDADREVLSTFSLYGKAAIYNVVARSCKVLENNYIIANCVHDSDFGRAVVRSSTVPKMTFLGVDYKIRKDAKFGIVTFYQTIDDEEVREKDIHIIKNKIQELDDKNSSSFVSKRNIDRNYVYIDQQISQQQRTRKINSYHDILNYLENRPELTDEYQQALEIASCAHQILLNDAGICSFGQEGDSSLHKKVYIKKRSDFIIRDCINYL